MTLLNLSLTNLQWLGCATGVLGSALLALNHSRISGLGFVAYLVSNACWIGFATATGTPGLLTQQVVFTATSLLGVWRWLVVPARQRQALRSVVVRRPDHRSATQSA